MRSCFCLQCLLDRWKQCHKLENWKTYRQNAINRGVERGRITKTPRNTPFWGLFRGASQNVVLFCLRGQLRRTFARQKVKRAKSRPALAVGTRLKPARNGRWVASAMLHASFFQPRSGGLQSTRRVSIPFKKCGFKRVRFTHRAGRCVPYYVVRGRSVTLPRPRRGSS